MKSNFLSRPGNANHDNRDNASTIGIIQALISVFIDDADKIRCIHAGQSRITFLLRPPLYYVCVSSWGEPESVVGFSENGRNTTIDSFSSREHT